MSDKEKVHSLSDLFEFASRLTKESQRLPLHFVPVNNPEKEWLASLQVFVRTLSNLFSDVRAFQDFFDRALQCKDYTDQDNALVLFETDTEKLLQDDNGHHSETVTIVINNKLDVTLKIKDSGKIIQLSDLQHSVQGELFRFMSQWTNPIKCFSVFCNQFPQALK